MIVEYCKLNLCNINAITETYIITLSTEQPNQSYPVL